MTKRLMFREHRGSFADSLETMREINDISDLGEVTVKPYGYDARLESPTSIVLNNEKRPIGFIMEVQ